MLAQRHAAARSGVSPYPLITARSSHDKASYSYACRGCSLDFTFPVARLEVWRPRIAEPLAMARHNPFAVVILAQLEVNATRDDQVRLVRKTELVRRLFQCGSNHDNIIQLFFIIDVMLALPEELSRPSTMRWP